MAQTSQARKGGPHGEDAFGKFRMRPGWCATCDFNCAVTVVYTEAPKFPEGIERGKTILKSRRQIGLDCGCYGKLHRQVAHIADGIKRRELVAKKGE